MATDFVWVSNGGILVDSTGDIGCTPESTLDSVVDIVRSRLKASVNGWQQYAVGAGLDACVGSTISDELELKLQRQVYQSLINNFLPAGAVQVETLVSGTTVNVLVFLDQQLLLQAQVSTRGVTIQ